MGHWSAPAAARRRRPRSAVPPHRGSAPAAAGRSCPLGSTLLIFLVILLAGAAAAYFFYFKPRLAGGPAPIPIGSGAQPTPEGGVKLQNDLGALKAGDALSFWDGTD